MQQDYDQNSGLSEILGGESRSKWGILQHDNFKLFFTSFTIKRHIFTSFLQVQKRFLCP